MKTWEKNIRQVLPYIPGEQPKQADIIKLNTNENPYPPSPRVVETLEQFQTGELRLYPDPDSNILVEALADFYQIDRSRIFVGVGSDDVLAVSFLTFFNSGKPVLFPDITYSFYDVWARLFQIPFEQIPLDGEFQIRKSDYFRENGGVGFSFQDSKSNFLFVTHPSVKAGVIYESLRAAGIYVRHFSKPERISDYLRIAVGTDQEMDCLLIKLKEILQQHGDLQGNTGECQ